MARKTLINFLMNGYEKKKEKKTHEV